MSGGEQREPGNPVGEAPRSDASSSAPPCHDYGPALDNTIGAASAVAGAFTGRLQGRTAPRGRAIVRSEEVQDPGPMPRRPVTPQRRLAPSDEGSGGSTPRQRRLATDPISGSQTTYAPREVFQVPVEAQGGRAGVSRVVEKLGEGDVGDVGDVDSSLQTSQ